MSTKPVTSKPVLPPRPPPSPLAVAADRVLSFRLRHPLWVLLLVAVLVRLVAVNVRFVIGTDEGLFLTLGRNLAHGLGYTGDGRTIQVDFPPGFSLFAALIYLLGGWPELPSQLNQLLFGSLLVLPIYWLGKHLATEQTGFRAALFVALVPALVLGQSNFEAVAEPLYTLLFFTAWALLWRGLTRKEWWTFGLAGLALGAAHLVRWEGVILGLIAVGLIVAGLKRAAIGPALIFLAGLMLFAIPYGTYLYNYTGSVVSPKTRITQWHSAALDAQPNDPFAYEKAYDLYENFLNNPHVPLPVPALSPLEVAGRYARNLVLELRLALSSLSLMTPIWLIPAIAGLVGLPRRRAAFLVVPFVPLGIIPLSVVDPRYFLPALPAALLLAACGWHVLDTWLPVVRLSLAGRSRRWPLVTILVALTLAAFTLADLTGPFLIPQPTEYRVAGTALRGVVPADAHILARKRQIPFYAGATWEWLPYGDLDTVLAYAASHGADYLVLDAATTPTLRPQLAYLLDPAQAPSNWTPIYVSTSGPAVVVYKISP